MKKAILVIATLVLPLFSFGQPTVFSTDKTRVIYVDIENKVSIAIPGYPCDDLRLESANCKIEGEGCSYTIIPNAVDIALLIVQSKKNHSTIDTIRIPVRRMPDPLVKIGLGKNGGGPLIKDGPIIVGEDCSFQEDFFQIVEFTMTIHRRDTLTGKDTFLYIGKNVGRHYEPAALKAIENALPGDRFYIEDIRVLAPDNRIRNLASQTYLFHIASKRDFNH